MSLLRFCLVLAFVLVSLTLANGWLARNPASSEPILQTARGDAAGALGPLEPFVAPQGIQFVEARERPIFSATRRPWSPPLAAAPVVEPQAPPPLEAPPPQAPPIELSLIGVQRFPGGAQALVRKMGETVPQWVRTGDSLDGWTVEGIESQSIRVSSGGTTRTFALYATLPGAPL